ncbi:oxidoreductase [Shimwellia pseudoproteus]|uniref:Gfo/Idh/MocA family oxidoreductase n=1 Tax=Shimwellia pseudoproteus TaxID=570012 RepID=UPI0018EB7168|nr:Gfo/Idh/MocA family oxidoreductase [Shimwellia pseudoproteus]MBJ3815471.1 oxidoreductase [Shimwellia pseudoproteus]
MLLAFVGLGAVVETAWLPAVTDLLSRGGQPPLGFDCDPARQLPGIIRLPALSALLAAPIDVLIITTASLSHLAVLEAALASQIPRILVEKPVVASLEQMTALHRLLRQEPNPDRVLAFDHWMSRTGIAELLRGTLPLHWQGPACPPLGYQTGDIIAIDGYLEEPSGINAAGEPVALNFATGEPDSRQFRHPDGVIMDTGPHVLAMLRENLALLGLPVGLQFQQTTAADRLGHPLMPGDFSSAEGSATITGQVGEIPFTLRLNKYAGPGISRKGMRIQLRQGSVISLDRGADHERLILKHGGQRLEWRQPGALYPHCVQQVLFNTPAHPGEYTRRRIEEVRALLMLHQQLRGPH